MPNNINITITPSSRPSTMDDASNPHSRTTNNDSRPQQYTTNPTATSPPPRQYTFDRFPTSSSSSSGSSFGGDYTPSTSGRNQTTDAAGRHVQGLPASALATVDAVLNRTPPSPRHDDFYRFDLVDSGEAGEDENSEIDYHYHQQKRTGGGGVTRDHPLGQESKISKAQPQRHIRLADPPIMATTVNSHKGAYRTPKVTLFKLSSISNADKETRQRSVSPRRGKSRPVDSGEAEVDRSNSNGSRGRNGGHFYNFENTPAHPRKLHQQQQQPSGYNNPYQNQCQQQQQSEKQDQLLEMYRTKTFMSELSFERGNGAFGAYGGDGGDGGAEKRGEYYAAMNFQQDSEMESRIVRKLDRHLLPLLGVLYLFSCLDRVNIGNARLFGLEEAVHLSNGQYNM